MSRVWAMPSPRTFEIPPIKELLDRYVGDGKGWIDPFAGSSTRAEWRNDLDPDSPAQTHLDAERHLLALAIADPPVHARGILFDPPYSPRQIAEVYKRVGLRVGMEETQNGRLYARVRDAALPLLDGDAVAISFGWNSAGFGKERGFELVEMLLVAHGGGHNDTIVTLERRTGTRLEEFA